MTNETLTAALLSGTPAAYNGITYKCISGLIQRIDKHGNLCLQAELLDRNTRSVTIVEANRVELLEKSIEAKKEDAFDFDGWLGKHRSDGG